MKEASTGKHGGGGLGAIRGNLLRTAFILLTLLYILAPGIQEGILSLLYPGETQFLHSRVSLARMTLIHTGLTLGATLLSVGVGVGLGVVVTRRAGKDFQTMLKRVNGFIQTFPPSAVIILAFPFLGFGWEPTMLALFLYSLFPVVGNTIVGFQSIRPGIIDAARGMGMSEFQRLMIVEMPQALPLIFTGIRHAFILNLGTAAIGAVIGAGGLGTIIISGLTLQNSALVLSGTIVTIALAFSGEMIINKAESLLSRGKIQKGRI